MEEDSDNLSEKSSRESEFQDASDVEGIVQHSVEGGVAPVVPPLQAAVVPAGRGRGGRGIAQVGAGNPAGRVAGRTSGRGGGRAGGQGPSGGRAGRGGRQQATLSSQTTTVTPLMTPWYDSMPEQDPDNPLGSTSLVVPLSGFSF